MYHLSVFVHIMSAIVWVGGLLFLALVVAPVTRHMPPVERGALIALIGRRFRPIGWTCLGLLVITGILISGWRGVTWEAVTSGGLWAGDFGRLLLVKAGLVAAMTGLSAVHDFVVGPASVRALAHEPRGAAATALRRQARWLARLAAGLALLTVAVAVALVRGVPR